MQEDCKQKFSRVRDQQSTSVMVLEEEKKLRPRTVALCLDLYHH